MGPALLSPRAPPLGSPEGEVAVEGSVAAVERGRPGRIRLRLEGVEVDGVETGEPLVLSTVGPAPAPGARIRSDAEVTATAAGSNPGIEAPWSPRRLLWRGESEEWRDVTGEAGGRDLRLASRAALGRALSGGGREAEALFRALLLGDKSGLDAEVRTAFEDSGTAHVLAISGLHLAVVGYGIYRLLVLVLLLVPRLAQGGRPTAWAGAAAGALVWAYVEVIAGSHATLRAALGLTLVFGGAVLARGATALRVVAVAATAILLADPEAAGGPSFQLSFAAALSLVLVAPAMRGVSASLDEPGRVPSPRLRRVARAAFGLAIASTATTLATAPLTLGWFGQWAPVGVLVNLVAVPLVSLAVVPLGFVWLVLGAASPAAGALVAPVASASAGLLLDLVGGWAEIGGPSTAAAWPHAAGVAGTAAILFALARRPRPSLVLGGLAAAFLLGALPSGEPPRPREGELSLTALDVGHGDALLLRLPAGEAVLVDTGGSRAPDGGASLARYRLVPALTRLGVSRLDLLVLTHADLDHAGAAAWLARRIPVRELWLPPCDASRGPTLEAARVVAAGGGLVRQVHRAPPFAFGGATLRILWPERQALATTCERPRNDLGLVISVEHAGRRLLLTADVERGAESELVLLESRSGALRADVLKVAHHGSRTSSTPPFLAAVRPRVALVSGELDRDPMPPDLGVVTRYYEAGVLTRVTGRDGAATVTVQGDGALRLEPP